MTGLKAVSRGAKSPDWRKANLTGLRILTNRNLHCTEETLRFHVKTRVADY